MSLLVTGSIGLDTVTTPYGTAKDVLGGTAVYFSLAAAPYGPVRLVGVVGEDFPKEQRALLDGRGIDLSGLETRRGSKTFRWTGQYVGDMNQAETLDVRLNVLGEAAPMVPRSFADSEVVFLANTHPALQRALVKQVSSAKLKVCDTIDLWIANERDALLETFSLVDGVIINAGEARQLTERTNVLESADAILDLGPRFVVIKKGEHGVLLMTREGPTVIPAFPTKQVKDPTGAGDSFAGGMLGYLASTGQYDTAALRRGLVRGTVAASFTIESFSVERALAVTREEIDRRIASFIGMLRME